MSDLILKFWPKEAVNEVKTASIKESLLAEGILGSETEHWNKPAYKPGPALKTYLETNESDVYFQNLFIGIEANDQGVEEGEDDFVFVDRHNVVSIYEGDGGIEGGDRLCVKLQEITGDEYTWGWDRM